MKTVREIYDFFLQYFTNGGKQLSLMDFMNTVPEFVEKNDDDTEIMNMSMGMEGSYLLPWVGFFIALIISVILTLAVRSTRIGRKFL